jgi:hypothetical protein
MMMHYKVVISGENIFFENYGNPDPVVGFIAFRLIEAQTEELAIATAKRDILVHWNQSFNADRRLGLPKLQTEHIAPFKGWIKPRIKHDYYWFSDEEHKQRQLDKFIKPAKKWFWKK